MSKLKLILLNLFFMLIFGAKAMNSQDTTIVGKAHNAKYGAVIVTSNNDVYYLDSLKSWSSEFIGKSVKVTGKISIKHLKRQKVISGGITSSQIIIIKKHKVELISGG
jgi:hypothetical protein